MSGACLSVGIVFFPRYRYEGLGEAKVLVVSDCFPSFPFAKRQKCDMLGMKILVLFSLFIAINRNSGYQQSSRTYSSRIL